MSSSQKYGRASFFFLNVNIGTMFAEEYSQICTACKGNELEAIIYLHSWESKQVITFDSRNIQWCISMNFFCINLGSVFEEKFYDLQAACIANE